LKEDANLRFVSKQLARIKEMDESPLTSARPFESRLGGTCRDFTVMLCAMLRYRGTPARARCGFGAYFEPDSYADHWVCEYWDADEKRWMMIDAQLDAFQREELQIKFNPLDVPADKFLPAGKAWQLYRSGRADPDRFGIFDMHGLWFIRGNVVRDLASLNRMELLPWDIWGIIEGEDVDISEKDMAFLDHVAALTLSDKNSFAELTSIYKEDPRVRVPSVIKSYPDDSVQIVDLYK
jgi:hypothetical protein